MAHVQVARRIREHAHDIRPCGVAVTTSKATGLEDVQVVPYLHPFVDDGMWIVNLLDRRPCCGHRG